MKRSFLILLALGSPLVTAGAAEPQATIEETRIILEKWVDQRKTIADRKADWAVEKRALQESLRLYQAEAKDLETQIAEVERLSSAADKDRVELEDKEKGQAEAADMVAKVIGGYEAQLLKLMNAFPAPLSKRLAEFARRIPSAGSRSELSLSERVQTLVAILGEVDKFNSLVVNETEFRKDAGGNEIAVETLYLGLGQAYFVSKDGNYAGVGYPENGVWTWVDKTELAPAIKEALDMYLNLKPAAFVGLEAKAK